MFDVFRRELTVRTNKGYYDDNGLWVNLPYEEYKIKASVQSLNDDILATLPEGYRSKENFLLITDSYLNLSVVDTSKADTVLIDGNWYQVVRVKDWKNLSFFSKNFSDHCEAIVVKLDDDNVN